MTHNRMVLLKFITTVIPKTPRYFLKTSPLSIPIRCIEIDEITPLLRKFSQVSLTQVLTIASLSPEREF